MTTCSPDASARGFLKGEINFARYDNASSGPDDVASKIAALLKKGARVLDTVREWALAAPKSLIKNIYSPTELTIACTAYRWERASSPEECEQGIVPIGEPFEGIESLIVDEQFAKRSRGLMAS